MRERTRANMRVRAQARVYPQARLRESVGLVDKHVLYHGQQDSQVWVAWARVPHARCRPHEDSEGELRSDKDKNACSVSFDLRARMHACTRPCMYENGCIA